jgi:hypothetical protein
MPCIVEETVSQAVSAKEPLGFFDLPGELRNQIYEQIWNPFETEFFNTVYRDLWPSDFAAEDKRGLLGTCSRARYEGMAQLLKKNELCFATAYDVKQCSEAIYERYGPDFLQLVTKVHLEISFFGPERGDMQAWIDFFEDPDCGLSYWFPGLANLLVEFAPRALSPRRGYNC